MEFENILKLIDSVSASSLDSFVYEQNGTKFTAEVQLLYVRLPVSRGGGLATVGWSLGVLSNVRGPSNTFERQKPLLYAVASSCRSVPKWHYAVVVGMQPGGGRVRLNSGIRQGQWQSSSKFMRTWDWGGRWAMLALQPGELPADADPLRYLSAVADFEAVAGPDAAAPAWAAAQQRWPGEPRVYLALGNQAHAAGDLAAAAGLYRQGLAHAPGEPVLSNNYASVMAGLGCPAQALAALDTVAAAAGSPWQAQLAQTRREVQALPSAGRAPAAQCVPLALSLP